MICLKNIYLKKIVLICSLKLSNFILNYIQGKELDKNLISQALNESVTLHFSYVDLMRSKMSDFIDIDLLMLSKRNKI